jgi:hypothetical protein
MSLVFTDEQVKNISKDALLLPTVIDDPSPNGNGYVQQKQQLIEASDNLLKTDEQNAVYSDNWVDTQHKYHEELHAIKGDLRTDYDNNDLINGGDRLTPHYTSTWPNLTPIVIPSVNGNPITVDNQDNEQDKIDALKPELDIYLNGWNDGSTSKSCTAITDSDATFDDNIWDFAIGHRITIHKSGNSLYGIITGFQTISNPPDPDVYKVQYTRIGGVSGSSLGSGATMRNYHAGFTNDERGRVTTNYAFTVQEYFESLIDAAVLDWKNNALAQKTAVDNNGDTNPTRITHIDNTRSALQNLVNDFTTWEGTIISDPDGKYTDTSLPLVQDNITLRETEIPLRIAEIESDLGSVVQAGDGTISGSGANFDLMGFIDIRIAMVGGSLYSYNQSLLGITSFDVKIEQAENQLAEYENTFAITKIVGNTDIGDIEFEVEDATDFSVGKTVKVMDNLSTVYTRTIDSIISNTIRLNSGIPVALTSNELARIVRQRDRGE